MATKVFTGAGITFVIAVGTSAAWSAVAAVWSDMNGDSGVVANTPDINEELRVNGALVDDLSIPAAIRVGAVQVEFDWHVINAGGGAGDPTPNSSLNVASVGTITQLANTDTTGHFDFTNNHPVSILSGGATTRAALFATTFGWVFQAPQRTGANTSRVVVTNFTITVTYVNVGVGSWLVRTAAMNTPTGAVDFATFAPDVAQVTTPSASGTIRVPIADTAGAYIYIDGGGAPVAIGGVPAGFTPDDVFVVSSQIAAQEVGDLSELVLAPLIDVIGTATGLQTDFYFTGMTLAQITALLSASMTGTIATGAVAGVYNFRAYIESDSSAGWDPVSSVGVWGSYTIAVPSVLRVNPPRGSVNGGQAVRITGVGFTAATGVEFGGVAATAVVIVSDTSITAVTPEHASGTVDVEVLSVATGADIYTYVIPPSFTLPPLPDRTPIQQGGGARGR